MKKVRQKILNEEQKFRSKIHVHADPSILVYTVWSFTSILLYFPHSHHEQILLWFQYSIGRKTTHTFTYKNMAIVKPIGTTI